MTVNNLDTVTRLHDMRILIFEMKVMTFSRKDPKRCKIAINGQTIGQLNKIKYLGNDLSYGDIDVEGKINEFF